ncbi:MAG: acyltransferase [Bacteroidales bacterium]|nr:acyltransferase [Bacteroidales bacterium]MCF8336520.1 acyltransferase [Bacteroidales bacterium]
MSIKDIVRDNPKFKNLAIRLMMPRNQARPRLWVKWFINPFRHKKGKRSLIRRRTRMDVMPWNRFELGNDSTIEDFATINNGVGDILIGERTRIGLGNTLIGPVHVGNDIMFAQNVVVSGLNHGYEDVTKPIHNQPTNTQLITIEDGAWIAANSVLTAGITVGKNAVVAAGSIVVRDVAPFTIVAGNPAKPVKQYNPETKQWEKVK